MKIKTVSPGTPDLSPGLSVFNLYSETGPDPERIAREALEQKRREADAAEFERRMQRRFEGCPGFVGGDMPSGAGREGRAMIEPAMIGEAMTWLKRRFVVHQNIGLSTDNALCVEFKAKAAPVPGGSLKPRNRWNRPEQFELAL